MTATNIPIANVVLAREVNVATREREGGEIPALPFSYLSAPRSETDCAN